MVPVTALLRREGMPMEDDEQPRADTSNAADTPARRRLLGMAAGAAFVVGSFAAGAVVLTGSDAPADPPEALDARSTSLPGAPEAPKPAPANPQQTNPDAPAPVAPAVHSAPAGAGDTSSTRVDPPKDPAPPAARPAPAPPRQASTPPAPPPAPAPQPGPLAPVTDTVDGLVGTVGNTVGGLVPALGMIDDGLGGLLGG